jgi:hypothetical protein
MTLGVAWKYLYAAFLGMGIAAGSLGLPYILTSVFCVIALAVLAYMILTAMLPRLDRYTKIQALHGLFDGRTSISTAENKAALRRLVLASAFLPFCGHVIAQVVADATGKSATPVDPNMIALVGLVAFVLACLVRLQELRDLRSGLWRKRRRPPLRRRIRNAWLSLVYKFRKPKALPDGGMTHEFGWVDGRHPQLEDLHRAQRSVLDGTDQSKENPDGL